MSSGEEDIRIDDQRTDILSLRARDDCSQVLAKNCDEKSDPKTIEMVDESMDSQSVVRHESVIRSTASSQPPAPQTPCFLTSNSAQPQNPFSKTSSPPTAANSQPLVSTTTGSATSSSSNADQSPQTDRSSVILAPSRLGSVAASSSSATSSTSANTSQSSAANSLQNNYFNNNTNTASVLAESRLSSSSVSSRSILRPSVLKVADSSTKNDTESTQRESKVFAFVSLSKEDITRPATTLIQSDSIIRCGADTTSPFNGEEAPASGSATTAAVSSTSSTTDGNGVGSEADDSNSQSAFIFGQNLEERAVVNKTKKTVRQDSNDTNCTKKLRISSTEETADNGQSSGQPSASNCDDDGVLDLSSTSSVDNSPEKSTSREEKRKYDVITGEEGLLSSVFFIDLLIGMSIVLINRRTERPLNALSALRLGNGYLHMEGEGAGIPQTQRRHQRREAVLSNRYKFHS